MAILYVFFVVGRAVGFPVDEKLFIFFLCLFFICNFVCASNVVVDGNLDEPEWNTARVFTRFVLTDPNTGAAGQLNTTVKLITSSKGVYIGFVNEQPYDTRKRIYSRKDQFIRADYNRIVIDFEGKGTTAFEFTVSLGEGFGDGIYTNGNQFSDEWEGRWHYAVSEDDQNWYSEIFIPWNIALYVPQNHSDGQQIGVWFSRANLHLAEEYSFPNTHWSRDRFIRELQAFSINTMSSDMSLVTIPQVTSNYDIKQSEFTHNMGADILYKPSVDQLLMATINPDFGTADTDELVSNFSPVEVFFPENRTFFTENHSPFDIKDNNNGDDNRFILVNTRRIGASNDDVDNPKPAELSFAGKYVNLGHTMDVAMLYAKENDVGRSKGKEFLVGRTKFHLNRGYVGGLVTMTDRPQVDRKVYTGALDVNYWVGDFVTEGVFLSSNVDVDDAEDSNGFGSYLRSQYSVNRNANIATELIWFDSELRLDDVGFLERNDIKQLQLLGDVTFYDIHSLLSEVYFDAKINAAKNFSGYTLAKNLSFSSEITDVNAFEYAAYIDYKTSGIDDLITFGHGPVDLPSQLDVYFEFATPSGGRSQLIVGWNYLQEGLNGWANSIESTFRFSFNDSISMQLSGGILNSDDWLIGNDYGQLERYSRQFRELDLGFLFLLSDSHEMNVRVQWNGLNAKGRERYGVENASLSALPSGIEDFSESDFSMQVKYQYRFAPLSELILVYARQGSYFMDDSAQADFHNQFKRSYQDTTEDVVTFKVRYAL